MKIMVVDDSELQRLTMEATLKKSGYEDVILADSASDALAILSARSDIDLILLDVVMPDINGIEACGLIKNYPHLKDIPIIIVTAKDDRESLDEAFRAGATDYLVKPPDEIEMRARIRSALSLKIEMDRRKAKEKDLLELTQKLASANQMLRRLSVIDPLTGIANRRYFDEVLDQEWKRARRERQDLSLIMIDIDNFKSYNDHLGHQAGDDCLKKVAHALSSCLHRPGDLVARYGGEEFGVVLPNTNFEGAGEIAENMRRSVEGLGLEHPGCGPGGVVTVSLGFSTVVPSVEIEPQDLVEAADQALYRAKESGRNTTLGHPGATSG